MLLVVVVLRAAELHAMNTNGPLHVCVLYSVGWH